MPIRIAVGIDGARRQRRKINLDPARRGAIADDASFIENDIDCILSQSDPRIRKSGDET
jgi:hypothetical protein